MLQLWDPEVVAAKQRAVLKAIYSKYQTIYLNHMHCDNVII